MTCQELDDRIEALAEGEEPQTDETRSHLEACPRCQAALARALQIERLIAERPAPAAPPRFTASVAARVRRERWESEQALDRWFNVAIAASLLLAIGGVWLLANVSGMAALGVDVGRLLREGAGLAADRLNRNLLTYVTATLVLASTVAIWWWAEETA